MADKISLVAILSAQAAGFVKGMKTATSSLKDFSTEIKGGFAFGVMAKAGLQRVFCDFRKCVRTGERGC